MSFHLDRLNEPQANASGTLQSIEPSLTVAGTSGADMLTGTAASEIVDGLAGNDTIRSGGGNDTLRGGSGDDFVFSGAGNDAIDGGEGYDHLYYTDATAGVSINMATGSATGGAGTDTITGIELVFGSPFADTYVGNDAGVGFLGGDGNDTITGGSGRDHLEGNGGDDTIDGLGGVDVVAYYSAAFAVDVDLTAGRATGGLGTDTLRHVEEAVGSVFGDTLKGSSGDNRLDGSDGNDRLVSTAGNDTLDGGDGIDTAVYAQARSAYTLQRSAAGVFAIEKPDAAGSDALPHTERLQFSDMRLALDLEGHAGQTAKLLGAVFGPLAVANKVYAGIGLSLLDGGMAYAELAALAVAAAGKTSHADIVGLLWTNLFGTAPAPADAAPYVAMLDGGMSVGALTVLAADSSVNTGNINLAGLVQTGLDYLV